MWSDETRVVVFKNNTTMKGVVIERESTLTVWHICHRTRIPFGHVLIERTCEIKHCKREGATKKRKTNPSTNNKKGTVSKHTKINKQNVWELWSDETRVVVFKITITEGVATKRGERVHLLLPIFVTALVFHLDTSWLNAYARLNTATEGATKKRKTNPPQTTKSTVFKTKNNVWVFHVWQMKLDLSY